MWGHARMPLRIAPAPLTPSKDPRLGVESHYQKLHRCALDGFLGPSSKLIGLTRILQPFASKFLGKYYNMFACNVPNSRIDRLILPLVAWILLVNLMLNYHILSLL